MSIKPPYARLEVRVSKETKEKLEKLALHSEIGLTDLLSLIVESFVASSR